MNTTNISPINISHPLLDNLSDPTFEDLIREQTHPETIVALPPELSIHGKLFHSTPRGLQLDDKYCAALYGHTHDVLFEQEERQFYKYNYPEKHGAWGIIPDYLLEDEVATWLLALVKRYNRPILEYQATQSVTLKRVRGMLRGRINRFKPFEVDRKFLHCPNGMILIGKNGEQHFDPCFSPNYYSRNVLAVNYDPEARCPLFDKLIAACIPEEDIRLVRMYMGQVILGNNSSQRMLILSGEKNSGKSTIVNTIQSLMGRKNCTVLRAQKLNGNFETDDWIGKTCLVGEDVDANFLSCPGVGLLRRATGGSGIKVEYKGGAKYDIKGNFNVVITSNDKLRVLIQGDAGAWERRILPVNTLPPVKGRRVEPDYYERLVKEEGSGILNWALAGLKDLYEFTILPKDATGWPLSSDQQKRINSILQLSDSLRIFIEENIVKQKGYEEGLTAHEIETGYFDDCEAKDLMPLPLKKIQKDMGDIMRIVFNVGRTHHCGSNHSQRGFAAVRFRTHSELKKK